MKKTITPVITGIRPAQRPVFRLHYHPDTIRKNIALLKDQCEEEQAQFLFEDIQTLVDFALSKLNIKKPTK